MKIYPRSLNIKIYLIIFLVLVFFGCATNISQPKAEIQTPAPAEKVAQKTFDTPQISLDADKEELSLKKEGPPGDLPKKPYPPN
ncbi:MAG TPA: hypothetical protein DDW42_07405, partial [Desulfobacteraceae bacterium]|nr:hypothetical protein [Desulfobacteraceae bacterium]